MKEIIEEMSKGQTIKIWLDRFITGGIFFFLALLPFHLVIKQLLPEPYGTYWKEGLLALLVLLWGIRCILSRKLLLSDTLLDLSVLLYVGLILLRLVLDRSGSVALWGVYISLLYLPLFWLVPTALRRYPKLIDPLFFGLTAVGALVALGGIVEFIVDRALWPSVELITILGYPDMYVYETHLRRVYFVFDSPATLANTLAIILPLAFVIIFQPRKLWVRVLAGIASLLMFTAIILTFSRGIWVALALAALVVVLIKIINDHNWKIVTSVAVSALLGLIIFGIVWVTTPISKADVDQYSVELLLQDYLQVPLVDSFISLLNISPEEGEPEKQFWTIFDPIENRDDQRQVIYTHPESAAPMQLIYQVSVPEGGVLRTSIALSPEVWTPEKGDGVNFQIYILEKGSTSGEFVFDRYINPKANPNDRRWRNYVVDLSSWGGKQVYLHLIAEAGPDDNYLYDWAGWADLELGSVPESFLIANWSEPRNPVINHLSSISDWSRDETNRDRLAAWNLGIAAWRQNPLWGNGLGTTGVAALRTQPESAFVTESQVLKSLVELGAIGLLLWGFLWVSIGRLAWKVYRSTIDAQEKLFILGLIGSLLVVFFEGLVYQNLEVKQVNAYFWTLTGVLGFLAAKSTRQQSGVTIQNNQDSNNQIETDTKM